MRRMILMTAAVFLLSMGVCVLSAAGISRVAGHADHLCMQAVTAMDAGDVESAEAALTTLATYIYNYRGWLEMLCEHENVHDIRHELANARLGLEFGNADDFYQSVFLFKEGLEYIADIEKLSISNLY